MMAVQSRFNLKSNIRFTNHKVKFNLRNKKLLITWVARIIELYGKSPGKIEFIICNDSFLSSLNKSYLHCNDLTDILTFNYNQTVQISGDIFISIERVKENAQKFNTPLQNELHRVIIHGVLHLLGIDDKTEYEKSIMRKKEDKCLNFLNRYFT